MKGDRVEAVVDTGQGVQTFEIVATRAGRRIEVTSGRGIVEVTEVTRGGNPVRTGRFMASRLIALVEHPALEGDSAGVDVTTRRRMGAEHPDGPRAGRPAERSERAARGRHGTTAAGDTLQLDALIGEEAAESDPRAAPGVTDEPDGTPDPVDTVRESMQGTR